MLSLDNSSFALPIDAEGGIGNDKVELVSGKLIIRESIAKLHVVGIAVVDHGVGHSDTHGEGIQLLSEGLYRSIAVQLLQALFHAGEHLAGTHGHIVHRTVDAIFVGNGVIVGQQ